MSRGVRRRSPFACSSKAGAQVLDTKGKPVIPAILPRHRWVHYAAFVWALCFAAPHTWWAFGLPFGFPGGPANHHLLMSSWWRYLYDIVVILLSILGAIVALALRSPAQTRLHRIFRLMAWTAAGLLTVRGVAGLVVDGASDPVWWPTFLVGGLLFAGVARSRRPPHGVTTTPGQMAV